MNQICYSAQGCPEVADEHLELFLVVVVLVVVVVVVVVNSASLYLVTLS